MKKTFFLFFILIPFFAFSQNVNTTFAPEHDFIKHATDSTIFILKQEFKYKDTIDNRVYPPEAEAHFGRSYALAILIDSVLWTDAKLFTPWLNDTSYNYYNTRYGWVAYNSLLSYRPLYRNSFDTLLYEPLVLSDSLDSLLNINAIAVVKPTNVHVNTLKPVYNTADTSGWALFIYADQAVSACDTCEIKIGIFKARPSIERNLTLQNQPDYRNILGGFYILAQGQTGQISFSAAGYLRRILRWYVKPFVDIVYVSQPINEVISPAPEQIIQQDSIPVQTERRCRLRRNR
ncbi:MAG: hypothetical protein PHT69_11640 [Bacteroidales bacterium]|nr:hypothetical protein [Bacteroidales bacterium]